jgi:Skp family chaperone for outer membrane proteins
LCFSYSAIAAEKVGIVDVQKVISDSLVVNDVNSQINVENDKLQALLAKASSEFEEKKKGLLEQQVALSEEVFQKKAAELQQNFQAVRESLGNQLMLLDESYKKALDQIADITVKVMGDVAKSQDIKLLFAKFCLLYSQDAPDLSEDVLQELNKRLNKFQVDFRSLDK